MVELTEPPSAGVAGWSRRGTRGRRGGHTYAFRIDENTFGIFDTFEAEEARQAHLGGEIPKALAQIGPDLLAGDPDIRTVDIIAVK